MNTNECIKYDMMVEMGIATPEEINLVKNIKGGTWNDVLDMICDVRTGYRTFESYLESEVEEEE